MNNNSFDLEQPVDVYSNHPENQGELSELPAQIPDIYLDESLDDELLLLVKKNITFLIGSNEYNKKMIQPIKKVIISAGGICSKIKMNDIFENKNSS